MVVKKGLKLGGGSPSLSAAEAEVLRLVCDEFLTVKQVAIRRHSSVQAVYKIVSRLKRKGLLDRGLNRVEKDGGTFKPNGVRLHGQEFNVKILFKDGRYKKLRERANTIFVDGNTVRLYRDSVEVYSGVSFFGEDAQVATARSFGYWNRFFVRLESDLKVVLVKSRSANVRMVKAEYARVNSGIARECGCRAEKVRVFAREDGKLWFLIDNSFNLHECETCHPDTAKRDMQEVVQPFLDDLRDNPVTLSEVMRVVREIAEVNKETAAGLNAVATYLRMQIPEEKVKEGLERAEYIG